MYILTPPESPPLRGEGLGWGKIARKGTTFCAHSQINCTKSAPMCTLWQFCAIMNASV